MFSKWLCDQQSNWGPACRVAWPCKQPYLNKAEDFMRANYARTYSYLQLSTRRSRSNTDSSINAILENRFGFLNVRLHLLSVIPWIQGPLLSRSNPGVAERNDSITCISCWPPNQSYVSWFDGGSWVVLPFTTNSTPPTRWIQPVCEFATISSRSVTDGSGTATYHFLAMVGVELKVAGVARAVSSVP